MNSKHFTFLCLLVAAAALFNGYWIPVLLGIAAGYITGWVAE